MLALLTHLYSNVEIYVVLLVWVTAPLGFYAAYLFMKNHYAVFSPPRGDEGSQNARH
jgi:hypothetical protein